MAVPAGGDAELAPATPLAGGVTPPDGVTGRVGVTPADGGEVATIPAVPAGG